MTAGGLLVVACGALVRELRDVVALHRLPGVTIECLPAALHNRPERIPDEVRRRVERARGRYERILVGYADCGTGGLLDDVCAELGVERLPGAHCYQLFAGLRRFEHVNDPDPSAFYLTDYLARHFDRLVYEGLGIASHPELADMYFANYTKVLLLAQSGSPEVLDAARSAADRLGLPLEVLHTGHGDLVPTLLGAWESVAVRSGSRAAAVR
jgi:hypothetical protein